MTQMLAGQVGFVTGAASGIGLEIAKAFAAEGAKVVLSDVDGEKVGEAAANIRDKGYEARSTVCDVTDENEIRKAISYTTELYSSLDILVNNAGMQHVDNIEDFPTDKFENMVQLMLTGSFMATKQVFPLMKQQKHGRIINMASINGLIGFTGKAAYCSAKHGLVGLTKVAALEGAEHGVTVNAMCPGYVDTPLVQNQLKDIAEDRNITTDEAFKEVFNPLVPQHRLLQVEEIADYTVFLASEKGKGVTGQSIVLDGGYVAQ